MNPKDKARRYVRLAVFIGLLGPTYEYFRFLVTQRDALYYDVVVLLGFLALAVSVLLIWFFGLPTIQLASTILHALFGRRLPSAQWQEATFLALWPLPIATMLGVVTWFVYSVGEFGGWPDDVIFGTIANLIGAWCYCTIFWSWIRLRRGGPYAV
jgi:hypothetical protein